MAVILLKLKVWFTADLTCFTWTQAMPTPVTLKGAVIYWTGLTAVNLELESTKT